MEPLRQIARNLSLEISPSTIRRYIGKALKWICMRARFGLIISAANKVKGHEFANMCIHTKDTFDNIIWTDESSVQLVCHSQIMRVKISGKNGFSSLPQSMQSRLMFGLGYQREEQLEFVGSIK